MSDEPKQCCGDCMTQERVVEIVMALLDQELDRRGLKPHPVDDGK